MRRQLQVGHQLLPVCNLGWSAERWIRAATAMHREFIGTCQLIKSGGEKVELALRLTASIQQIIAAECEQWPAAMTCDAVRHLVAGLRRQGEDQMADELVTMFNTVPGYLRE